MEIVFRSSLIQVLGIGSLLLFTQSSASLSPYLETYYEPEIMESAPHVVTNLGQPTTINDKLLVRPRLLFARTRSKDSARFAGSEMRHSFATPDFDGKYASWSEYDRASSPSLHHVKKEPIPQTIPETTISSQKTSTGTTSLSKNPADKKKKDKLKVSTGNGVETKIHGIPARQETNPEPVSVAGTEDQTDLSKDDLAANSGQENEDTKLDDDEPDPNRYNEEVGKEGYIGSGYILPEVPSNFHLPEDANFKDNPVPMYPPLDREKLYNKSFLIYLKDFRPGQY